MKKYIVSIGVLLMGFASNQLAADETNPGRPVKVSIAKAYIPQGFDSNDRAQVVIEGFFPNTCYRVGPHYAHKNEKNQIEITQTAYVYGGKCLMMVVPFTQTINIGVMEKAGEYLVKDVQTMNDLGSMTVAVSKTIGPDDFIYANVTDAYVGYLEDSKQRVVIRGTLPGSCWDLVETRVFPDGKDVLTVLPIMQHITDDACDDEPVPFVTTADLPKMKRGRYLLNVRSLNGQSINKLFDMQ